MWVRMCDISHCANTADNALSGEQCEVMEIRFELPIKNLCKQHYQEQFLLYYLHNGKTCCDPRKYHKKSIKLRLSEVSLDFSKQIRDKTEYRVFPGFSLCRACHSFLEDLITSNASDEELDSTV